VTRRSWERPHKVLSRGIVTKCLADVNKTIHIAGTEDKAAAKLKRIFADPMLAMPASLGTRTGFGVIAPKQMKDVRALQFCRTISLPILVNEQWEIDFRLFAELVGEVSVTQADGGQ
jgi:hypothetical protein